MQTPATATPFVDALLAAEVSPDRTGAPDLYARILGDWEGEVIDHTTDGDRRQSVELHVRRVLEGRAVQDLWIAPARRDRNGPPAAGNRYGTTLRFFDPALDAWRITWINPVSGIETRLVGRPVDADIVQTGADSAGKLVRWIFDDIQADRFHWRGDVSEDGGRTWFCQVEFFFHRSHA